MIEEQDRVSCHRVSLVALEGRQMNRTAGADPNIKKLSEGIVNNEDWDLDGAKGGK